VKKPAYYLTFQPLVFNLHSAIIGFVPVSVSGVEDFPNYSRLLAAWTWCFTRVMDQAISPVGLSAAKLNNQVQEVNKNLHGSYHSC
jgi:hypothetical protein